jgi:hypothetical protein
MSKLVLQPSTLITPETGAFEYDGGELYFTPLGTQRGIVPSMQYFRLNSIVTGSNAIGSQSVLGVGVALSSNTVYAFKGLYLLTKTAGTTSHVFATIFGGTASINNISYRASAKHNTISFGLASPSDSFVSYATTNSIVGLVTANNATTFTATEIEGTISVNTGGTFIPQYSLSAAPGGAYTTQPGSYFLIYPVGAAGSNTSVGTWA